MTRRRLLLILDDDSPYSTDLPSAVDLPRIPPATSDDKPLGHQHPFTNPPSDSSSFPIAIIVLLTALFFMAFFSLYLRCFSGPSSPSTAPRVSPPPPSDSKGEGADADVVRSLPLVGYRSDDGDHDCPVCLTEFEEGETVKVIPRCRHVFHPDCLDAWLSSHASCPLCRSVQLSV